MAKSQKKPVACTMEAKICPDGSAVGRTGPNCEFSPCPISAAATVTEGWLTHTDVAAGLSYSYPPEFTASDEFYGEIYHNSGTEPWIFGIKSRQEITQNYISFLYGNDPAYPNTEATAKLAFYTTNLTPEQIISAIEEHLQSTPAQNRPKTSPSQKIMIGNQEWTQNYDLILDFQVDQEYLLPLPNQKGTLIALVYWSPTASVRQDLMDILKTVRVGNPGTPYTDSEYGLGMTFPADWKGFSVIKNTWQGWKTDGSGKIGDYIGPEIIFRNPNWTEQKHWQDIPIMVFTPDVWALVQNESVGVSAAPVPPAEVGSNSKYIFATPPRWYGFTDDLNWQEAVDIVKTFKAF